MVKSVVNSNNEILRKCGGDMIFKCMIHVINEKKKEKLTRPKKMKIFRMPKMINDIRQIQNISTLNMNFSSDYDLLIIIVDICRCK